jgi:hypothetical protein
MARIFEKSKSVASCARWAAVALLCCLFFIRPPAVLSEPVMGPEYEVKIGFIYNFANFVTWPQAAFEKNPDTLILCLASDNPSSDTLYKLDGKRIRGRKIKVIAYQEGTCVEQSHILFFATRDTIFIQQVLELVKGRNILTIGEVEGFTRMGGVINFFEERNRLRFRINIDAAQRQGLKMSSQLLGSAQIVKEEHE